MYNYDGILYRIWGVAGFFVLLGVCCVLVSSIHSITFTKKCFTSGIISIVLGIVLGIYYTSCYVSPVVESIRSTLIEECRDSRVAPPLPLTMKYIFLNDEGYTAFYLDVLSEEMVLEQDLELGKEYIVFYESRTDIIVGISVPE